MHFYAINLTELYKLPIYTFWELAKNINRIRAEEDLRLLAVIGGAFGGSELADSLISEMGEVIDSEESVSEGINKLKSLMLR